jgi:hypothetical protein
MQLPSLRRPNGPARWGTARWGIAREAGVIDPGGLKPRDGIGVPRTPIAPED